MVNKLKIQLLLEISKGLRALHRLPVIPWVSVALAVVFVFQTVMPVMAADGIRQTINFQGKLVDQNGLNVPDNNYTVVFTLYNDPSAGSNLWDETQTVSTVDGVFQVELGSVDTTLGNVNFNSDLLYLGIKVGADLEMTPRIRFTAVPYAFNAKKVNGLTVTNTSDNPFSSTTILKLPDGNTYIVASPQSGTTDTIGTLTSTSTFTNKTIGSTGLTFSGAGTDITTGTNEDFTFALNGSGDLVMNSDFDSGVAIGSSANTPAPLSISGGIGSNAALIVNQTNSGDLFVASQGGATRFRIANNGDVVLSAGLSANGSVGTGSQCLLGGATASWGTCGSSAGDYWRLNAGLLSNGNLTTDFAVGGSTSESAKLKVSLSKSQPTASISADSLVAGLIVDNINSGALLTASKAGDTKFVIMNNGTLVAGQDAAGTIRNNLILPNTMAHFSSNVNSYGQVNAQNRSNGNTASTDFIATADNGNDTTNYIDFGINSSAYNNASFSIVGANDGYLYNNGQNLAIGTQTSGKVIKFHTGGTLAANERMRIDGSGNVGINTTTTTQAIFDVRGVGITTLGPHVPVASISGQSVAAAMVVDNNGTGALFTASKSGATKFLINNNGTLGLDTVNYADCGALKTNASGQITCGAGESGNGEDIIQGTGTLTDTILLATSTLLGTVSVTPTTISGDIWVQAQLWTRSLSATDQTLTFEIRAGANCSGTLLDSETSFLTSAAAANGPAGFVSYIEKNPGTSAKTYAVCALTTTASGARAGGLATATVIDTNAGANLIRFQNGAYSFGNDTADFLFGSIASTSSRFKLSPLGTDATASVSADTSYASLVVNNNGFGDILTASKSGATKFTVLNSGDLKLANYTIGGGFLYTNTTGTVLQTLAGNSGECLKSAGGATPTWGACSGASAGYWELQNGLLYNGNITTDFAIGGTTSESAKLKVSMSKSQPTASISADSLVAGLIVDNINSGALFTASKAGDTKFAIMNNGALIAGPDAAGTIRNNLVLPNTLAHFAGNVNSYGQVNVQNRSNGNTASSDFVATADNGSDTTNYVNFGINSSGYSNPSFTIVGANDGYLYNNGGNLAIGTQSTGRIIKFHTAGTLAANERLRLDENGNLGFNTNITNRALFDIRGVGINTLSPHIPVASISGLTSAATMVVDNSGIGALFTASKSGDTKFAIMNNGALVAGPDAGGTIRNNLVLPNTLAHFSGNVNSYGQVNVQNRSNGNSASSDFVATADNGSDTTNYINFGINSSSYSDAAFSIGSANDGYLYNNGGNLAIGTQTLGKVLKFHTAGTLAANERMRIDENGNVGFNTTITNRALFDIRGVGTNTLSPHLPVASISGQTVSAAMIVDNNGTGDIFHASKSGATKFAVLNSGDVRITNLNSATCDVKSGTNGVLFCGTDATGAGGSTNYLNLNNGSFSFINNTADILIGGPATSSAKFAFMNLNSNSGLDPLASFSGTLRLGAKNNSTVTQQTTWTKISQTTPGTIANGGTANIASISAMTAYNGSVYVGTYGTSAGTAEIYRYDGTNSSWTKVSQTTPGTIASGGTSAIASVSAMTVYDGRLYVGTSKVNQAEIYRYEGSTSWTKVSAPTVGTIKPGGTANIDGVASLAVFQGALYAGTREPNSAQLYRYTGMSGANSWGLVNATAGVFHVNTSNINVNAISSMVVYNGFLYLGLSKPGDADVVRYNGGGNGGTAGTFLSMNSTGLTGSYNLDGTAVTAFNEVTAMVVYNGALVIGMQKNNGAEVYSMNGQMPGETAVNIWNRLNQSAGTITNGGTANIDGISTMTVYNGQLYVGTTEGNSAEIYRHTGGDQKFVKVSQAAGTIASGGTSSIDGVVKLLQHNGDLYAGTMELGRAEVYKHTSSIDRSYGLEFVANPQIAGGAQNGNLNSASIFYLASASANLGSNNGNTGAFIFSHGIQTRNGSYDVAEDYPTRDDTLEPGDIVSIDPNERGFVKKSENANDYTVIGVYSADPALRLSQADASIEGARAVPIALAGRVAVKVSTESGAIKPGDYLTASSTPGVAMKAVKSGGVIGQAMESYDGEGVGKVLTYIKSASYQGNIASNFAGFEVRPEREGQDLLAAIATQTPHAAVSEIVTDKLIAGLKIVSPEISADKLQIRTIEAVSGDDIGIILKDEGTLSVKNASGEASMIFTGTGDAYFAGHVQAQTISAEALLINDIVIDAQAWEEAFSDGGLESIASRVKQQEELLKSQESRIVSLENLFASQSASIVTPTPVASDAAMITLLATMPAIEDFERTKAKDYAFTNMPTDGLATFSGKLAADRLQVTGSAIIEGILHVVEVLTARTLIVDDLASFLGKVVFSGDVFFEGRPTFNKDTAGIAVIKKGTDRIAVRFEKEYASAPMVNVNVTLDEVSPMPSEQIESLTKRQEALEQRVFNSNVRYLITKRTSKGFVILLDKKADEDIAFSWIVVAVDSPLVHKEIGDNFTSVSGTDSKNAQPITTGIPTIIPTSSMEKREAQILPSPKEVSDGDPPLDEAKEGGDAP